MIFKYLHLFRSWPRCVMLPGREIDLDETYNRWRSNVKLMEWEISTRELAVDEILDCTQPQRKNE